MVGLSMLFPSVQTLPQKRDLVPLCLAILLSLITIYMLFVMQSQMRTSLAFWWNLFKEKQEYMCPTVVIWLLLKRFVKNTASYLSGLRSKPVCLELENYWLATTKMYVQIFSLLEKVCVVLLCQFP